MSNEITVLLQGIPCSCQEFHIGAAMVALCRTKERKILFNTGPYSERLLLVAALKKQGLTPADIDVLVLSQLHWDTAINVDLFRNSEIYIHRDELRYSESPAPEDTATPLFLARHLKTMPKLHIIERETALADGVTILPLPGNSPGAIGLLVDGALFAGDAVPNVRCAYHREIPYPCHDPELAKKSLLKALQTAKVIYPGHDRAFAVQENGLEILDEINLRIRFFFNSIGQDQEVVVKSEKPLTFVSWPN
ncbi:MAG TPA: MBL fold metallo-hydrolase [Clostridia bacterium]|nr:MBL fold metallo-hydrolase [Clostridia bacterium]